MVGEIHRQYIQGVSSPVTAPPSATARGIEIALGPEVTRAIGLFRLPVTEVTFTGYDETQADAFLARIDLHYHRGGG